MSHAALDRPAGRPPLVLPPWRRLGSELLARERRLTLFALIVLVLMIPTAIAWGVDDRVLRGVNIWIKPLKFMASLVLFALTTAWFIGHLPPHQRRSRAIDVIVWMVILTSSFEVAYITLQASRGVASHYNVADAFHAVMYALMGIGALLLTVTQPMLAWQIYRHGDRSRAPAYRLAVLIALVLTFVMGAGVGGLLSDFKPPETDMLPLIGWSLSGGDLRPAHFVGIHAQQIIPLVGLAAAAWAGARAGAWVIAASLAYAVLFAALVAWGLPN